MYLRDKGYSEPSLFLSVCTGRNESKKEHLHPALVSYQVDSNGLILDCQITLFSSMLEHIYIRTILKTPNHMPKYPHTTPTSTSGSYEQKRKMNTAISLHPLI